jgi:hypothetical protein
MHLCYILRLDFVFYLLSRHLRSGLYDMDPHTSRIVRKDKNKYPRASLSVKAWVVLLTDRYIYCYIRTSRGDCYHHPPAYLSYHSYPTHPPTLQHLRSECTPQLCSPWRPSPLKPPSQLIGLSSPFAPISRSSTTATVHQTWTVSLTGTMLPSQRPAEAKSQDLWSTRSAVLARV